MGDTSATGVAFTRNPSTGEKALYGEFLVNAQGEDVVAGIRTPQDLTEAARIAAGSDQPSLEALMPEAFCGVRQRSARRSRSTIATCRTSSSPSSAASSGCCRRARASAPGTAALKIAVDMADEGLITRDEAVLAHRPARPRPAPPPDHRSRGGARPHRERPARLAGRRLGRDRLHARGGRGAKAGRARRSSSSASRPAPRTSTACTRPRASSPPAAA